MNKFLTLFLGAILGIVGFILFYHSFNNLHVTAVFEELEPFPKNLNLYYKGFKIGRSIRVRPSKDFTKTNVDLLVHVNDLSLPDNITAKVKTKNKRDYIELIYPDAPSVTYLKNHSVIKGERGMNFASFIQDQADSGGLDNLTDNLSATVASAGQTMEALTDLFHTANDILKDVQPNLKESSENLALTTRNLASVTGGLNRSAKPEILDSTFSNIELITKNLEVTTSNTVNLTKRTNKETIELTNCLMKNLNVATRNLNQVILNINDIIKGFKVTLSKRFAGMRLVFGKPLE